VNRKKMELERERITNAAWLASGVIKELFVQLSEAEQRIKYLEKALKRELK
jgi:hypothetical protein